jgi:hypothetical protein
MADFTFSKIAAATTDTLRIDGPASGLQWIIWQLSVETIPFEAGATVIVRRNGRLITSSVSGGRAAAQGPPAVKLTNSDVLDITWQGVAIGDELVCTLMVESVFWGELGTSFGLV